jgi:hypothetical protein
MAETQSLPYLTKKEAARRLRRSASTMNDWRQRGIGPPAIKVAGGKLLYASDKLEAWIEQQNATG